MNRTVALALVLAVVLVVAMVATPERLETLSVDVGDAAFRAALPARARPYATAILTVARETGVPPDILFGLGDRETNWGTARALDQQGPAGTGDKAPRDPARWGSALPPDGRGWGRGLMQIDWGSFADWCRQNDWTDPLTNIRKGAAVYLAKRRALTATGLQGDQLTRAALAAYNAGEGKVGNLVRAGLDPDSGTSGGDYGRDVLRRAASVRSAVS